MSKKIKQAVKHTGRARKEQIVAQLVEKINATNSLVFTDYKGITHKQLEDLKKDLKKIDATIVIAKNSLIKISLGKSEKYADYKDNENLDLPTATLLLNSDYVEPLKRLQKAIKEFGLPKVKFGIVEGQLLDDKGVLKIASLPNKETLLTQLVGTLNSPISGFVMTLNAPIQKFVMTLNAIAQTRPPATEATGNVGQDKPSTAAPTAEPSEPAATPAQEQTDPASEPATDQTDQTVPAEIKEEQTAEEDSSSNEKSEEPAA